MKRTATLSIAAVLLVSPLMLPGCQSASKQQKSYTAPNPIKDEFEAGRDRKPTAQTLYAMARLLVARGRDEQAVYVLNRVIQVYPEFIPAYNELAEVYMRADAVEPARSTLDAALVLEPHNALLHNNLGLCRLMSDDPAGAEDSFARSVELAPRNARYHANHATALAMLGEYDAALQAYLNVVPEADAHYNLAVICESRGDTERAAIEYALAEPKR